MYMVDNDYNRNIDQDQYGKRKQNNTFDGEYVEEDVDAIQDPYPSDDIVDSEDTIDEADENEESDVHEYEDNDHPHEYRSPTAVIDDYRGASEKDTTNPFERQNSLQSTYPASSSDK
jgi:hypothetical protein